jgi:iron complex outermembrane recepter protein
MKARELFLASAGSLAMLFGMSCRAHGEVRDANPPQDGGGRLNLAAQPASAPSQARATVNEPSGTLLEDIVVTARKREESIQDIPVSVTAYGADDLKRAVAVNLYDLSGRTPNLTVTRNPNGPRSVNLTIRGQTVTEGLINTDAAVGLYIDGVPYARLEGSLVSLVDLKRVEVLRGPQGTLFGRNTTGGAVSLVTQEPVLGNRSSSFRALLGNYDLNTYQFVTNVPLGDRAAMRVAMESANRSGYVKGTLQQRPVEFDDEEALFIRPSFKWQPNEALTVELRGDRARVREASPTGGYTAVSENSSAGLAVRTESGGRDSILNYVLRPGDSNFRKLPAIVFAPGVGASASAGFGGEPAWRINPQQKLDVWGYSGMVTADLNSDLTFKTILGRRGQSTMVNQGNSTPYGLLTSLLRAKQQQSTAEVQVLGKTSDGRANWVVGTFYFTERGYNISNSFALNVINPSNPSRLIGFGKNNSKAVFGQANYELIDRLHLTAGIRYTKDIKSVDVRNNVTNNFTCTVPVVLRQDASICSGVGSGKFDAITYTASGDYQVSQTTEWAILLYAKYSRGFRSGGENLRSVLTNNSFEPEYVNEVESGFKADLLAKRLRINTSVFYQDYKNIQRAVVVVDPAFLTPQTTLQNAASAHIHGFESELTAILSPALELSLNASHTNARYERYLDPATGADLSARHFTNIPKWSFSGGLVYQKKTYVGTMTLNGNVDWRSRVYFGNGVSGRGTEMAPYTFVNLRAALGLRGDDLEIGLWCKNCTDRDTIIAATDTLSSLGFSFVTTGLPRTLGVDLSLRFQ